MTERKLFSFSDCMNVLFPNGTVSAGEKIQAGVFAVLFQTMETDPERWMSGKDLREKMDYSCDEVALRIAVMRLRGRLRDKPALCLRMPKSPKGGPRGYKLERMDVPLREFWKAALEEATRCVVIGNQCGWLENYHLFTGVGEGAGLFRLGVALGRLGIENLEVWDSESLPQFHKRVSYVFVGSTVSNGSLEVKLHSEFPKRNFVFESRKRSQWHPPRTKILDRKTGKTYKYDESKRLQSDYVVLGFRRTAGGSFLWVGGISTYATWAGLLALHSPRFICELMEKLEGKIGNFEALLRIPISGRRPLATETDSDAVVTKIYVEKDRSDGAGEE